MRDYNRPAAAWMQPGLRYGRLTVIEEAPARFYGTRKTRMVRCLCDCGVTRSFVLNGLRRGSTRSCGCYHSAVTSAQTALRNLTHGDFGTPLYNAWSNMIQRCENQSNTQYKNYWVGAGFAYAQTGAIAMTPSSATLGQSQPLACRSTASTTTATMSLEMCVGPLEQTSSATHQEHAYCRSMVRRDA